MKSEKTDTLRSPPGRQAPVGHCGRLWGHRPSPQYALPVSVPGRSEGHLTTGLCHVVGSRRFEHLFPCVSVEGRTWSGRYSEPQDPARLEEGAPSARPSSDRARGYGHAMSLHPEQLHNTLSQKRPSQRDPALQFRNRKAQLSFLKILIPREN